MAAIMFNICLTTKEVEISSRDTRQFLQGKVLPQLDRGNTPIHCLLILKEEAARHDKWPKELKVILSLPSAGPTNLI